MKTIKEIEHRLFDLRDESYKDFQASLVPTMSPQKMIGIRIPVLRKYAKELSKTPVAAVFLSSLPHYYYDEDNLHAFLIEQIKDVHLCIQALDEFLPYVNNWATCDSMSPKILRKEPALLLEAIDRWLASGHVYAIRFAIISLMRHFLDYHFDPCLIDKVSTIHSDDYYINMARAWYFATALAKQWDATISLIQSQKLDTFTHNKTIQKSIESYRIPEEHKEILRGLRRKKN